MKRAYKLREIDNILSTYKSEKKIDDINHILDLYAVFELLKEGIKLPAWDDTSINNYKNISKEFPKTIGVFVSKINNDNFLDLFTEVTSLNRFDFWKLFNDYKIYEKVSDETFDTLLKTNVSLSNILAYRKIVEKYDVGYQKDFRFEQLLF